MKTVENVLKRATIKGVTDYLLYGENNQEEKRDCETRLEEAYDRIEEVVHTCSNGFDNYMLDEINNLLSTWEEVYMEIGFTAALKIMMDYQKLK